MDKQKLFRVVFRFLLTNERFLTVKRRNKISNICLSLLFLDLFMITAVSPLFAYVCNTNTKGPLTVLMNKPEPLKDFWHPGRVVTVFENDSDKTLTVSLNYSTLAPLEFPLTLQKSKQIFRDKISIPPLGVAEHTVIISAPEGTLSAHYPVNLDAVFKEENGSEQKINVVYPVETKLPLNKNWKVFPVAAGKKCAPWLDADSQTGQNTQSNAGKKPKKPNDNQLTPIRPNLVEKILEFDLDSCHKNKAPAKCPKRSVCIQLGDLGMADASIIFESNGKKVSVQGLRIWLDGKPLYECQPGPFVKEKEQYVWTQKAKAAGRDLILTWSVRQDKDTVRFTVDCDLQELISKVEFGPWSQKLENVWFGHGFLVKKPASFSIAADAHSFSTSYAGFDFENGFSLTMASSLVPDALTVDHQKKNYSITVGGATMMTIVPGDQSSGGAFDCAVRYRGIFEKSAAPGVQAKAGRFVVDVWNGQFTEHQKLITEAAERYGLKNDLIFLSHNWQKNHYDHRLPDVWPPNPLFGSKEQMIDVLKTARKYGWYFGIHHNVIDYYPDAPMFDFKNVAFDQNGVPQKAYRNVFLDAQSYRLAPHRAADVLADSLREMNKDGFLINCCFVDVLSSGASYVCRPYYDINGKAYAQNNASEGIKRVYSIIRDVQKPALEKKFGTGAPDTQPFSISEGGHDFTLGAIDGADCQFMNIVKKSGENNWFRISQFEDSEKVPWFDVVNHQKYILHGAGYSIRYESGRGRELHGLESDDYICAELLTGHPIMVDAWTRDVRNVLSGIVLPIDHEKSLWQMVRMYYLAQPVMRELAHNDIEKLEFNNGNIHQYVVRWTGGTSVYINRDEKDWKIGNVILPQYGYLAKNEKIGLESKIHRLNGRVVEESTWKKNNKTLRYVNARNRKDNKILPVSPLTQILSADANRLKVKVDWKIFKGQTISDDDWQISLFLVRRKGSETAVGEDYLLKTIRQNFSKPLETELRLPENISGKYDLLIGVVPVGKNNDDRNDRMKLLATSSFFQRYHLGEMDFSKDPEPIFIPFAEKDNPDLYERLFPPKEMTDFGFCKTKGGFCLEYSPGQEKPLIRQLPDDPKTEIILK